MKKVRSPSAASRHQRGAAMIEVLVSMLIVAFGILGMFGLQSQATLAQMESYQRAQALVLVKDMVQRIEANGASAPAYVGDDVGVTASAADCTTVVNRAARDLCEWALLLQGAAEISGTSKVGAMIGARGCITQPQPLALPSLYQVSVVWQGLRETAPTPIVCGQGQYTKEDLRRGASQLVQIPGLAL